jgi:hypothetical protein
MSGAFMSTVLEKSRINTIQSISGAFVRNSQGGNEITLFVMYDDRDGSSRKRKRKRTKRRKTNKKRRTNRRK